MEYLVYYWFSSTSFTFGMVLTVNKYEHKETTAEQLFYILFFGWTFPIYLIFV